MSSSKLDYQQVLQHAYDDSTGRLKVDTSATVVGGAMEVLISHDEDSIKIGDGTDFLLINPDGSIDVNITGGSLTLGSADKTAFTYGTTDQLTIGGVYQDGSATLTSGQSGAVRLTQYRAVPTNLRDSSGNELLGQKAMAASIPVVVASDQANIPVETKNALVTEPFDYISASYPTDDSEVYTYKLGGSGGSTVATVTVTYTDDTKESISSVEKT
jgi:hypothetical protein